MADSASVSSSDIEENPESLISILPNEILDYLFNFLTIKERILTELVCRRWLNVGRFQTWSGPQSLVFDPHKREDDATKGKWCLTDASLTEILSRCGPSVRRLVLVKSNQPKHNPKYSVQLTEEAVSLIGKYCPNLENVKLQDLPLNKRNLEMLAHGCSKLKTVHFKKFGNSDEGFAIFYKLCHLLEFLTVEPNRDKLPILDFDLHNDRVHGEGFDVINPDLKVLNLNGCDNLKPSMLKNLQSRCHCLQELRLTICYPETMKQELILAVLEHFKDTLKVLDLFLHLKPFNWCSALRSLCKLEELHMHAMVMVMQCPCIYTKSCFDQVSQNLHVVYVSSNFTSNSCDVDYVLTRIFLKCDYLQELHLIRCSLRPDTMMLAIKYGATLRVLDLRRCNTEQFNWCGILALFENLEKLRLDFCDEVTDDVMRIVARDCIRLRTLNVCSSNITDEGLIHLASLPYLTVLDISDCDRVMGVGIEVLGGHGRLEELYAATCSDTVMNITDDACCSLATFCPNFRRLDVSDVLSTAKISDKLVGAFRKGVLEGFLKNRVELVVGGTAVNENVQTCDRLDVLFNYYFHSYFNSPTINPRAEGRFASFPTF